VLGLLTSVCLFIGILFAVSRIGNKGADDSGAIFTGNGPLRH
jgi:hypothetical protein